MKRISKTEIKEMRSQSKKNRIMFAFTLPTVILYTIFFLVTMLIGVYYSFTDWNGISKDYTFVGLKNYVKVLTDERFREALWFNIGYTIALVVLLIVIPLTIALALNRIRRLSTLFRSIYFIPAVISMVTVGLIWNELFYRAVPAIGEMLNIEALSTSPLGNPKLAAIAIMVVNIWQGCAIPTVLFIAGLQSVPKDLLEAATIDGAGNWARFWNVIIPYLIPVLNMVIITQAKAGLTVFDYIKVIYQLEGQNGVNITENEEFISISKGKIEARVRKYPWEVSYYLDGKLKTKEQIKDSNVDNMCKNLPVGFTYDENKEIIGVNETMYLYADEEFYGFGEKFTDFGKRGQTINCWQTDALSTNTEKSYKNHPFFMSSRGYAILLNTYTRSKFEMGSFSNVAYNMSVEDKVLDYVIWMGNDYKALLKSYINQTGKIPMIPKWALGLWMSKCSYQTQDEIYEVVKISKERDIKIDVIHIDGWQKEGDAGAWVWDYERFPNPEEMIYKLKKEGIHLCLWIFPYIDENSKYFKEAEEKGFLVKNTKGVTSRFYSTATSTSKVGCFDFTNPHFIEWYKPKVRSVVSMGIGAVKTDFSEAVPEDAVYFDGSTGIQGHNKLTFLYAKTIYDIMAEVKIPLGELPMLWGRSGYAGSHTIPAAWAGDSSTHLNNHACILRGGLSASMSGIPFWGFDMGGFYNTDHEGYECVPTDEEYIRSCQFGFFNSLSRCHGKTPREPWNFGEKAEKIFKKFNDIRHLLLPYLYSTTYKTHLSDIPVIRPVVMEYPEDRSARNVELEYFLGDSLLVVPVFDQEDEIDVYLPNGQWIDLFTHERIKGGRWVKRKIELDKIPVFIRQNKMIPMLTKIPENIEEKYENLDVILFCEDEIRDTYIDDGNVQNLKAKIEEGTLFINTDMDASYFTVYAEKCLDNAVVNGQNWEIKKEKEGYYKIALEK